MTAVPRVKGHWPKGKRRKPPVGISVKSVLRASVRQRGLRATARALGVDPRTVKRWMNAETFPNAEEVERIVGAGVG